jgi:hypothetical protein
MSRNNLLFTSLLIAFTLSSSSSADDFGKVTPEEWALQPSGNYQDAGAVILFNRGVISVVDQLTSNEVQTFIHVRTKVFTRAGVQEAGNIEIPVSSYEEVVGLEAHTLHPDGRVEKVPRNAIFKKKSSGFHEYSFAFPAVEPGCILEYKYQLNDPYVYWLDPWYFQSELYTIESKLSIRVPGGYSYSTSFYNVPVELQTPKEDRMLAANSFNSRLQEFTWTLHDLEPFSIEPYMGLEILFRSAVRCELDGFSNGFFGFNKQSDWKEIGRSSENALRKYREDRSVKSHSTSIARGITDPMIIAESLYVWVRDSIATDGFSSLMNDNRKFSDILKSRSAHSGEKNLYLWGMLKARNINSYPVYISTRDNDVFDPRHVRTRALNHALTMVELDSSYFFLDASVAHTAFAALPPNSLVAYGLIIDGEKTEPIKIPPPPVFSIRLDKIDVTLDTQGVMDCTVESRFTGYFVPLYADIIDKSTDEAVVLELCSDLLGEGAVIDSESVKIDTSGALVVSFRTQFSDRLHHYSPNLLVRTPMFAFAINPFTATKRVFPIEFVFPRKYVTVVTMALPGGYLNLEASEPVRVEKEGLRFISGWQRSDSVLTVTSRLDIEMSIFHPDRYADIQEVFSGVAQAANLELVITAK